MSAITLIQNCCVLAAVGQGMVARKGVAATMMGALAKAAINIKAIAQGSSEYNITVLIDQVRTGGWEERLHLYLIQLKARQGHTSGFKSQ